MITTVIITIPLLLMLSHQSITRKTIISIIKSNSFEAINFNNDHTHDTGL